MDSRIKYGRFVYAYVSTSLKKMKIEKTNSKEYEWGKKCKGWHLVNTNDLSIIQELMPRGTEEIKHMHSISQQFFYILEGQATFIVDGKEFEVNINQGMHIKPNVVHQIKNKTTENLEFIVISATFSRR